MEPDGSLQYPQQRDTVPCPIQVNQVHFFTPCFFKTYLHSKHTYPTLNLPCGFFRLEFCVHSHLFHACFNSKQYEALI
jgi:hypothetical protein